jgi:uncharacterized protein YyaL (SSP411 family)
MTEHKYTNRLINETSPYLLQHAHNPVDWFPWGEEALTRSRREDKPILLSIGYSACHWCHVMERESFENEVIARLMNERFIPIKVDREERPDLDDIYMNAVQLMTGSGGWPLTVFLTPDLKPFYGGTYFPPVDGYGRPGFRTLLLEMCRIYEEKRGQVDMNADAVTERLKSMSQLPSSPELLSPQLMQQAVSDLAERFDAREGGFGPAPKFPPSGSIAVLLRFHRARRDSNALHMVELTLDKMAAGGMYDHLGGGFHRYSTDERWLVPHFEKMLYDNALLARVYLEAFQLTKRQDYARVAQETLEYVLREMQGSEGGYYSTQDADSEGEEGKFYVWSRDEVDRLLGEQAEAFCRIYDVTSSGNWEKKNILNRPRSIDTVQEDLNTSADALDTLMKEGRRTLFDARNQRVKPGLDDKILTSWNGLMIIAMSLGYRVLGDERFLESAAKAARFVLDKMTRDQRLLATYRDGRARFPAYLDDYAFLIGGLIELYESDFDLRWIEEATRLAEDLLRLFWDDRAGGFFFTGADHESLLLRPKSAMDAAIPSGNAMAATYFLKLAAYTGISGFETKAQETIRAFHAMLQRFPSAFTQMLCAIDYYLGPRREIAVVGPEDSPDSRKALDRIWRTFIPNVAVAFLDPSWPNRQGVEDRIPLLKGKKAANGGPFFYLCQNYACQSPTKDVAEIEKALRS